MSAREPLPRLRVQPAGGTPTPPYLSYLSVCSGIEAATVAWHPLGFQPLGFSEIEPFPAAVLAHRWPGVPNLGDMTLHHDWTDRLLGRPDILVGGTPCQAFSIAGLRRGLADPRGNLTLVFLALLEQLAPRWVLWENVPGVLSDKTGAFGAFLGGLAKLGYGWAYRVLDAQHFGVPQRRRRVFVVGHLGDWRRAAAVLFERHSLCGHSPPRREAGERPAPTLASRPSGGGGLGTDFDLDGGLVTLALRGEGFDASEAVALQHRDSKGPDSDTKDGHLIPIAFSSRERGDDGRGYARPPQVFGSETVGTLDTMKPHCVAFNSYQATEGPVASPIMWGDHRKSENGVRIGLAVRRLTPRECERLQGFPDDYTRIPGWDGWRRVDESESVDELRADGLSVKRTKSGRYWVNDPDGPRYKSLGNSMAVPVMRWIGRRLAAVDAWNPTQAASSPKI